MRGWVGLYGRHVGGSDRVPSRCQRDEQDADDHKGPPHRTSPLSPLRMLMGLLSG